MSTVQRFKAAIVGCGDRSLGGYFPFVNQVYDLVATCDEIEERAKQTARIFEADAYYADIDTMLAKSDVDVVIILTNMASHGELALKSVQAGKHVMLQKPFCTDMETGLEVIRIAREKNLKILVEPNYWVNPIYQKAKEILNEGHIGMVHYALGRTERGWIPLWGGKTFYEEAGGGMLFDMGVYIISALVYMLGPALAVSGSARISLPDRPPKYSDDHFTNFLKTYHHSDDPSGYRKPGPTESERVPAENKVFDNTFTLIEWPNDCLGCVIANSVSIVLPPEGARIVLCGDKGTMAFGMQGAGAPLSVATLDASSPYYVPGTGTSERERAGWYHFTEMGGQRGAGGGYLRSMQELHEAIVNDSQPNASMDYGMHVAEIMIKSFASARSGRRRRLITKF